MAPQRGGGVRLKHPFVQRLTDPRPRLAPGVRERHLVQLLQLRDPLLVAEDDGLEVDLERSGGAATFIRCVRVFEVRDLGCN